MQRQLQRDINTVAPTATTTYGTLQPDNQLFRQMNNIGTGNQYKIFIPTVS